MHQKRVVYFDLLNICAALAVVFLHCNGNVHVFSDSLAWKQALIIEVCMYWAVPIFFMLSGANLMGYREKYSTSVFFKKRILRTAIPFLAWSLICAIEKGISPMKIGFRTFINQIFTCQIESIYWFFIPLFSIYLALPILSLLKEHRKILWYMAGGALLLHSVLPSLFSYIGLDWNGHLSMLTVGGYLIFPILGYLFATTDFTRWQRIGIYLLGFFGAGLRFGMTLYLSLKNNTLNRMFFDYLGYYSVFLACAVFVFFKYCPLVHKIATSEKACKVLKTLSGCSFGVYLMHMIIFRFFERFLTPFTWQWRLLMPFAIYAIALGVTYLLKKIPGVRVIIA